MTYVMNLYMILYSTRHKSLKRNILFYKMHKSLKEIVEAVDNPALEESWIKRKGEELFG